MDFTEIPGMDELMEKPAFMEMLSGLMDAPDLLEVLFNAMGGEGEPDIMNFIRTFMEALEAKAELKHLRENPKVDLMVKEVKGEGLPAALKWLDDEEMTALIPEALKHF